ncbi:class I SAM-dependent methyltransferase [Clostridium sp. AM58-1XD]|uniref:class I SAM-dependent methyltransferase n=1 Tax=Clostridium sp. AM58-1XD TaxID=2292307 RepID=UPI001FA93919|nr:class I SAM-dependent methyltransferase [Clostridium sp. AM58-1XD]
MKNTAAKLNELWERYKGDTETLLSSEKNLDYLYALSKTRENLLEWFPFQRGKKVLQVGADCGALTGAFLAKGLNVTVIDPLEAELAFLKKRYKNDGNRSKNLDFICINETMGKNLLNREMIDSYDYVMIIGSLKTEQHEIRLQLETAKELLSPGGFLFVAADNPSGLKHWAGAPKEENAVGKKRLAEFLEEGEKGSLSFYYPFPDYKLPTEVYSDRWLPEKGDLSGTVISYDYPEFLKADVGTSYDMICEEGQFAEFANSFLAVWKRDGEDA